MAERIWEDPEFFYEDILGETQPERYGLYPKQLDISESVRDNFRTAVVGCTSSGKDWLAGREILRWILAHKPAKAVVTGPSTRQVSDIVWRETRLGYYTAQYPLGGSMMPMAARWEVADDHFAMGFATDKPYKLQGFHSPHLLLVITEAHAMRQVDVDAMERLQPDRVLLTGNALSMTGEFYDAFHSKANHYNAIHISAFDTPNLIEGQVVVPGMVTKADVDDAAEKHGEDSNEYKIRILGEWPTSLEDTMIGRVDVDAAIVDSLAPSIPKVLAVDVARYGSDSTVVARRDGPVSRIVWAAHGKSTMETVGWIMRYLEENRDIGNSIVVDDTGVGGGVTDRLREQNVHVLAFNFGGKARLNLQYANAGAEAWSELAKVFRKKDIDIEDDRDLIADLVSRRYRIQSDRRIILESKDELRKRGGRSPDRGDALAMTYSPLAGTLPIRVGTERKESRWKGR